MKKVRITENAFGDGNVQVREVILRTPDVTQEVLSEWNAYLYTPLAGLVNMVGHTSA